ncbi:hypothetical protein JZ751_024929 [Albula glossodonta]|uniref:Uncharacterized protein n=1 Tax=Albula glossodonta TaxID=121402 RepID=A0A8T2PFT2_9TELE|nr:hypothetical protein JZ751_024929 [Albula glossodonta]
MAGPSGVGSHRQLGAERKHIRLRRISFDWQPGGCSKLRRNTETLSSLPTVLGSMKRLNKQ